MQQKSSVLRRWGLRTGMTFAALLVSAILLAGIVTLYALTPGEPYPIRGADGAPIPGSISERVTVEIGGISQDMFIQRFDPSNQVLRSMDPC